MPVAAEQQLAAEQEGSTGPVVPTERDVATEVRDGAAAAAALDVEEYRELLRSAEVVLDAVDRALVQLGDGNYGACTECGEPIDDARLAADPTAERCGRHDVDV